jgi:RHS repeat-associated protein
MQNDNSSPKNTAGSPSPLDRYTVQPKGGQQDDSPFYKSSAPSIGLPKGGGALKGIDEKFSVNSVNGTAGLEIPLPFSPGRGGFSPSLSLSYNSGGGNSEFGLGFGLGLPSIQRRTDKQLPLYNDTAESDVFLLAGAEDLVPTLDDNADPVIMAVSGYVIKQYRPRIEGLFARIEYIKKAGSTGGWWRVTTKDNMTTYYGLTAAGRISDPDDASRIFKWLPQIIVDYKGNVQQYTYLAENTDNVSKEINEKNRLNGLAKCTNTYLKRVLYCNKIPYFIDGQMAVPTPQGTPYFVEANIYEPNIAAGSILQQTTFLMEAVFDYGDHGANINDAKYLAPEPAPNTPWLSRSDAFSSFHAGFEIRTYRKCRRVLMFHHFTELGGKDLVRALELSYKNAIDPLTLKETSAFTEADLIVSATQRGYDYRGGVWRNKALPAMTFDYQPLQWDTNIHAVSSADFKNAPQGLTGPYQWMDLDGEGISGIFTEQADGWFYKDNLGNGHFGAARSIATKPSFSGLGSGSLQWQDLDADGNRQVVSQGTVKGYWEISDDQRWQPFRTFAKNLNIDWNSPFTKMLDLNGDGKAEILITEDRAWTWYENLGKEGFDTGGNAPVFTDEEKGPVLLLRDTIQSIFLADINGDGLTDLVRIKNGEICYWPNMGYGKFGPKVTMANAPVFQTPELYNPLYLSLADISGTGAADLIYVGKNKCTAWVNLGGNGWSNAIDINPLPGTDAMSKIAVLDFLGKGTGCIVWSSPLPQHATAPLQYIDLMGGIKPYLMRSYNNGMGKSVSVQYKSSTQFYLDDKLAGISWATKLPFPVQCISSMTTTDSVSETSYTQSYKYRHGYYDHEEREFRGFGYVETKDIETAATSATTELDQDPVLTKTWNHTGAWLREDTLLNQYRKEYFQLEDWDGVVEAATLPLSSDLNAQEWREAHRALKGSPLRQEVYALNGTAKDKIPFSVTATAYTVNRIQPQGSNRYASFTNHQQQSIAFGCEQDMSDPRMAHQFTLETDEYGNVLKSASVAYPRQFLDPDYPANIDTSLPQKVRDEQAIMHISYSENSFTNDVIPANNNHYRLRVGSGAKSYEVLMVNSEYPSGLWTSTNLMAKITAASVIDFSSSVVPTAGAPKKRLLSQSKVLYKNNNADIAPLALGVLESLAIAHEQYQLAFTPALLSYCYGTSVNSTMMDEGGYETDGSNNYWVPSGTVVYTSPVNKFYTAEQFTDPWGNSTTVSFGTNNYWLLPVSTLDSKGNITVINTFDWRLLQPLKMTDANNNISEILYDALGMSVAMAFKGKDTGTEGDTLSGLDIYDGTDATAQHDFFFNSDPTSAANTLLKNATWRCVYDLSSAPTVVGMIARQQHVNNPVTVTGQGTEPIIRYTYSDGMGRVIMHKAQAETDVATPTIPRWMGSGRTIYNNKGKEVMQFEPYFSPTHACDTAAQAAGAGVSSKQYYDALNRVRKIVMPDTTFTKTEWTAWEQHVWDSNDTVLDTAWYINRKDGNMGLEEKDAALKAAQHANTPTIMHTDSLARVFYTIQDENGPVIGLIESYVNLDALGNRSSIVDGLGRTPLTYRYNMLKHTCWQKSIDSGYGTTLIDVAGQALYAWDADNRRFRIEYDSLRRITKKYCDAKLLEKMVYGDDATVVSNPQPLNLRGQLYEHYDGSGKQWMPNGYDFKGNPVLAKQSFFVDKTLTNADWSLNPTLNTEEWTSNVLIDALNRPVRMVDQGGNTTEHLYDHGSALKKVKVGGVEYVKDIHYDAKGQRQSIWYGNDTKTSYTYDALTYRLTRLLTVKISSNDILQDLNYYYDPVGNITTIKDATQQPLFFNNTIVSPTQSFTYDALSRLIQAKGRELKGTATFGAEDNWKDSFWQTTHKGDGNATQTYVQNYTYDAVGNIKELQHVAIVGSYTRTYAYASDSNRLTKTIAGSGTYLYPNYDTRGNMLKMPHLSTMDWNVSNELNKTVTATVTAYYQYSGGQRVRKYVDKGSEKEERIYFGNFEIYRKFDSTGSLKLVERTTLHVSDDTGRIAMREERTYGSAAADNGTDALLTRYVYSNHLQSASLELNEVGDIIGYEEYHPYGTTSYQANNALVKACAKRYRYTGKERDEESGLYYHGARYYVPWLGRWCSPDPINNEWYNLQKGQPDRNGKRSFTELTASPYEYCYDNPILFTDPTGEQPPLTPDEAGRMAHSVFSQYMKSVSGKSGNWVSEKQIAPGVPLQPDLLYFGGPNNQSGNGSVWELKPVSHVAEPAHSGALVQAATYALAANYLNLGGLVWDLGTKNGNPKPFDVPTLTLKQGEYVFNFFIKNPAEGLIYYTSNAPRKEPKPKTVPEFSPVRVPETKPKVDTKEVPRQSPIPGLQPVPSLPQTTPVPFPGRGPVTTPPGYVPPIFRKDPPMTPVIPNYRPGPGYIPLMPPQSDPSFIDKVKTATGLSGAALIIYLIISEGTRVIPARNLIPII